MTTYRVTATRDGDWWSLVAADVDGREDASQSRRLDRVETAIREATALVLDHECPSSRRSATRPGRPGDETAAVSLHRTTPS